MAATITTLKDSASTASFEWVSDTGSETGTLIDVSSLSGAGDEDNQTVTVTRIEATVVNTAPATASYVTLSWGSGTDAIYLPPGVHEIETPLNPDSVGGANADLTVVVTANTIVFLRVYVAKRTGFPLSMGHSRFRP